MIKFNLIRLVLFTTGGILISRAAYSFLMRSASRNVMRQADALMAGAGAARNPTS
jgi:hypothetical protein